MGKTRDMIHGRPRAGEVYDYTGPALVFEREDVKKHLSINGMRTVRIEVVAYNGVQHKVIAKCIDGTWNRDKYLMSIDQSSFTTSASRVEV